MYLRAKCEVSSMIVTSFRLGGGLFTPPLLNKPLKSPPRLGLIGIFQVFWVQFDLATVRAAIFKNTSFSHNTFNGCISCFSRSMIQKIIRELIKLETVYFLHGRCHYLHTYSQLETLNRSEIKLSIKYFSKPALNFEKRTRPEKVSATRL